MIADRYTLDREIGRGGMGAVWLARDEVLGRHVALKRIGRLPGANSTDLARAEREARLAARLNHPHVVAVFNLVVEGDDRWLVMEYVDGTTLADLVRREGPLSPDDATPLLRQAADALVEAHAAGIVHRDVKPSNILVTREGQVKLTDFGIAHIEADASLTQTGLVTGSPAYLAPEVAAGQRAGEASDVWSLGATVFYLLSGRTPYDMGDNVLAGLYRIVNDDPPRLADAGRLGPLLLATMAKDPTDRWSMTQVRDHLAELGDPAASGVPVGYAAPAAAPAVDPSSTQVLTPVERTRRPLLVGLVALALAVVLGLVLVSILPGDDPPAGTAGGDPSRSPAGSPSNQEDSNQENPEDTPPAEPTAAGMEQFIRGYVAAVSTDPAAAWQMLTPKFQRESGGLETYRDFWADVGAGEVLEVAADPEALVVSYRVRFDNFGTGRRPTVLDLVFDDGRYLIDGERTEGS